MEQSGVTGIFFVPFQVHPIPIPSRQVIESPQTKQQKDWRIKLKNLVSNTKNHTKKPKLNNVYCYRCDVSQFTCTELHRIRQYIRLEPNYRSLPKNCRSTLSLNPQLSDNVVLHIYFIPSCIRYIHFGLSQIDFYIPFQVDELLMLV